MVMIYFGKDPLKNHQKSKSKVFHHPPNRWPFRSVPPLRLYIFQTKTLEVQSTVKITVQTGFVNYTILNKTRVLKQALESLDLALNQSKTLKTNI